MASQKAKKASGKVKSTAGYGGFAGGTPALPGTVAGPPGAVRRLVWAWVAWAALLGALAPAAEERKPGPLSVETVKKLLAVPVTDNALAKHLRDYGAGFDPTPAAVAELKGLGAGPKAVAVLEELAAAERERQEAAKRPPASPVAGQAWANPATGIELVWVPPGSFTMGSPDGEKDRSKTEGPQHRVTFARGFWMGKYEVTVDQYRKFAEASGYRTEAEVRGWSYVLDGKGSTEKGDSNWRNPHFSQTGDHPVTCVSWNDVQAYVKWLNGVASGSYRMPTEAEWEYACRAGTATPFAFGDRLDSSTANFNGIYPYGGARQGWYREKTTPVGSFKPNSWGLYDMHGNVREWCEDAMHFDYLGAPSDGSEWVYSGSVRILRGGSWRDYGRGCRSAARDPFDIRNQFCWSYLGCRLVYVPKP